MNAADTAHIHQLNTHRTLVLNADMQPLSWMPLSTWSWQEAVSAVLQDRVIQLKTYEDLTIHSATRTFEVPAVVCLRQYHKRKTAAFTRYNLFLRDGFTCQYCGARKPVKDLTFDHVLPRSRKGPASFENIVAACQTCKQVCPCCANRAGPRPTSLTKSGASWRWFKRNSTKAGWTFSIGAASSNNKAAQPIHARRANGDAQRGSAQNKGPPLATLGYTFHVPAQGRAAASAFGFGRLATGLGVQRIVLTLHRAFEMRAALDCDCLVDDITLDTCRGGQTHLQTAHAAHDTAVDDNVVGDHFALDRRCLANGQQMRADITLNSAFDLNVAGCLEVADHMQVRGQGRCRWFCLGCRRFEICRARSRRGRCSIRSSSLQP